MSKKVKVIGTVAVLVLIFFGYRMLKGDQAVDGVRDTHFEAYDGATVGELFEQYFEDSEWVYEEDREQVVYTGTWKDGGDSMDVKISFDVEREEDGEYYTISSNVDTLELDGEVMDDDVWIMILEDMIDSYEE